MFEIQDALDQRFNRLRDTRHGAVFFIEHGLNEAELSDITMQVRRSLETHPIESGWWQSNSLPLLVASTEIGYRYRGTGTDFWPLLEVEFGMEISAVGRQRIRDLFASAAETYRGACPPTTRWARAFRLIAWPITHALLPLEFHRPLATTLANLQEKVSNLSDEDLYRSILLASSSSSERFSTMLENASLVVALTKKLLGEDHSELSHETVQRIAADLASDQIARRAVAVARRIQRTAPERPAKPKSSDTPLSTTTGSLILRRYNGAFSLEAVFPAVRTDLQVGLRNALRRRRYSARLWGVSARVPSEQLLSGLPFTLKLTSPPPEGTELLQGLEQIDIEKEHLDVLSNFKLDITPPLLFAVTSDGEHGRRVQGPSISGHRKYWLLSEPSESPQGCAILGAITPYNCHLLDPAEEVGRKILCDLGFEVHFGVSVGFGGSPPLDHNTIAPVYAVGDKRTVVPRRTQHEDITVKLGDEEVQMKGDEVITLVVEEGDHILRVLNGHEYREFVYRGVPSPRSTPPFTCSISPRSNDLTIQAFLRGALEFEVDSCAPFEGLEITVQIQVSGRELFATAPLDPLPCLISSENEPFSTLLDDQTRGLLAQASSLTLRLSVGHLCSCSVVLEQRVRPCWWERAEDGKVALKGELGAQLFGSVPASAPAARPLPEPENQREEARLLVPIDLDVSEFGGAARFTTLCIAPSRMKLETLDIKKPRLVRRLRAHNSLLGLEDIAESYLMWSLAESSTFLAEIRRRQVTEVLDTWIAEVSCGEEWVHREMDLGDVNPWEALIKGCDETGLGRDPYIELSREDELAVTRLGVRQIQDELPELWSLVGPPSDLNPEDYEALDLSCGRAYTELACAFRSQGRHEVAAEIEGADPGAAPEEWDTVLESIRSSVDLQSLAELLLPSDSAQGLVALEPSMLTLDELTEELTAWARSAKSALGGNVPSADTQKAILALWLDPEAAVGLNWSGALQVLLSERPLARAARYLALRSRRTSSGTRNR